MYIASTIIPGVTELLDRIESDETLEETEKCSAYGGAVSMASVFLDGYFGEGNWYFGRDDDGKHVILQTDIKES